MTSSEQTAAEQSSPEHPFRFYDNREKYLLFVTTTNEKDRIAQRIGRELELLSPSPPALRVFDAGMGDATVLHQVLEEMHHRYPTIPFVVVGKEISMEDTRLSLMKLHTRFAEHPETVVIVTNMYYREAPWLRPSAGRQVKWHDIALDGSTAHEFGRQLRDLGDLVADGWQTELSPTTGNPLYVDPTVLVLYRQDHAFALEHLIPKGGELEGNYDLVIAAQPYRSRASASFKVDKVLAPLAEALAPGGRMVVVQATGRDPGMDIIRAIWPGEEPFTSPRRAIIDRLNESALPIRIESDDDADSLFTYGLHHLPQHSESSIGTSMLIAAWNAAVYVAQVDDERTSDVMRSGAAYIDATEQALEQHDGLWFENESFVVVREAND